MEHKIDIEDFLFNNLLAVSKPARYIGKEINEVKKDFDAQEIKFALCFPDIYEVGMSHLGFKILYGILNSMDGVVCERVFSPWPDFEELLLKNSIELFSLESKKPLKEFDVIGFSLSHELNYTNMLNILKLGNIGLKSDARGDDEPIVIAGGHACVNPEPIADFIDAFVIGEAEEVIAEIIEVCKSCKKKKDSILRALAAIEGIYVPSLYTPQKKIKKRFISDFNNAYYPADQIVPYISIIHDRISLEIMRGCAGGCRFCQAGMVTRPLRYRTPEKILEIANRTYALTGYEEISLMSLSSIAHPCLTDIITLLNECFNKKGVSISLPSLRVEENLKNLPFLIAKTKKTGLTFAPEAGSERLRNVIRKNINMDNLFSVAQEAFKAGWKHLKLYFIIGLPGETMEDIDGIVRLVRDLSDLKKAYDNRPAHITISLSAFIPKPHTPFQWEKMEDSVILKERINNIQRKLRKNIFKVDSHNIESSFIEAVFSRGDRKLGAVLLTAFKSGCRFDNWTDRFNFTLWLDAFRKENIDPYKYTSYKDFADPLSWDIIDVGIGRDFLIKENECAQSVVNT
ncbi:MAG: TIGR03960 family B12-binding radical SAM protein [Candidatus Omnitrophota bacterium]